MNIPSSFKLANINFKVEIVDSLKGSNYGEFNDCTSTIKIANRVLINDDWYDVPDHIKLNTFYHELFHVFCYYYNTETPEDIAQVFANFMTEFLSTKK